MAYTLAPSTDHAALLEMYRSLKISPPRPNDFYDNYLNRIGPEAFSSLNFLTKDSKTIGLVEFGQHFLFNSNEISFITFIFNPKDWNQDDFINCLLKVEDTLSRNSFKKVTVYIKNAEAKKALLGRGYRLDLELIESNCELFPLANKNYPSCPEGFRIRTFAELENEFGDAAFKHIFPLVKEILCDTPGQSEQGKSLTKEQLQKAWQGSHFIKEASFFIEHDQQYIGIHNVVSFSKETVYAGITGILRPFRRRGLMRSLKEHGLIWAAKNAFKIHQTFNEINNPMLQLNHQLGFKERERMFEFSKEL